MCVVKLILISMCKTEIYPTTSVKHEIKQNTTHKLVDMFVIVLWSLPLSPLHCNWFSVLPSFLGLEGAGGWGCCWTGKGFSVNIFGSISICQKERFQAKRKNRHSEKRTRGSREGCKCLEKNARLSSPSASSYHVLLCGVANMLASRASEMKLWWGQCRRPKIGNWSKFEK